MKKLIFTLFVLTAVLSLQAQQLMTNPEAYQQMLKQYELRKAEFQSVITSYSIHYTKLYEPFLYKQRK